VRGRFGRAGSEERQVAIEPGLHALGGEPSTAILDAQLQGVATLEHAATSSRSSRARWALTGTTGMPAAPVSAEALAKLREYNWPGNVRELENIIERAMILARGAPLNASHLDFGRRVTASCPPIANAANS